MNKILKYILLILLTPPFGGWGALSSCSKDDDNVGEPFGLEVTQLVFGGDGGKRSFKLSADKDWVVTSDAEWCLVSPTNGDASTVCEVRVDTSYLYSEREAHLNFHCGNKTRQVSVSQLGYEKVILLDKELIEVPDFTDYESMFEEVKVKSNVPYEILVEYADASRSGWLKAKKVSEGKIESVPRDGKVRFNYSMYLESDRNREATVIFRQTDAKEGEIPVESRLKFRQTKAEEILPGAKGDSLALLALSRIMNLSVNWDTSQPMMFWNNIDVEDVSYTDANGKTVFGPRVVAARFTMFETNEGIPYHVRYLDQLRELSFVANGNAHLKDIDLGEHVTYLPRLKYLTLIGYGISRLPERMKQMDSLVELELSGNNLTEIPVDIIAALDKKSLRYINMANNRKRDVFGNLYNYASERASLGIHGTLPSALFQLKNIRYIGLSYNYLEGEIPDMGYDASKYATLEEKVKNNPVMPQLEQLSINLNFFSGAMPDWLLYHPNLRCWDPYTLVFNQYERARDSRGHNTGFTNEPATVEQVCHLWDNVVEDYSSSLLGSPSNASYGNYGFNRKNTFNPSVKYETRLGCEMRY